MTYEPDVSTSAYIQTYEDPPYISEKKNVIQHINDLIVNWLLFQEREDIPEYVKVFKVIYMIKDIISNLVFLIDKIILDKYEGIDCIGKFLKAKIATEKYQSEVSSNTKKKDPEKKIPLKLVFLIDKIILNKYEGIDCLEKFLKVEINTEKYQLEGSFDRKEKHYKAKTLKIKSSLNNKLETFVSSYDDKGKPWEKIKEELENKYKLTENDCFLLDYLNRINNGFKHKDFISDETLKYYYDNKILHLHLNNEKAKISYSYSFSMFHVIAECSSIINKLSSYFKN